MVDPQVLGIEYTLPPLLPKNWRELEPRELTALGPQPGYFAVSVHFIRGGSFSVPTGKGNRQFFPLYGYAYFQNFRPIARAGYSIQIFHLKMEEVHEVRSKIGLPETARGSG